MSARKPPAYRKSQTCAYCNQTVRNPIWHGATIRWQKGILPFHKRCWKAYKEETKNWGLPPQSILDRKSSW